MSGMRRRWKGLLSAALLSAGALQGQTFFRGGEPGAVVLRGATLHPVSMEPIANGAMLVEDGKIVMLGKAGQVSVPEGAKVLDLKGKHVYPGFVLAESILGLTEISSVDGPRDFREVEGLNSDLRAEVAFNADSLLLPVAIAGGVLTAQISQGGGSFSGTSAVMTLAGWNWRDMTMLAPAGMRLNFPAMPPSMQSQRNQSKEEAEKNRERRLKEIDDALDAARDYRRARDAGEAVDYDAKLEALLPVLDGVLRVIIRASDKPTIEAALDWAVRRGLNHLLLVAGPDAAYVAERLAKDDIPVVLDGVHRLPQRGWEPYDAPFTAAARLHEAGVRFCIGSSDYDANVRNLAFEAATAAAYGLPKDVALRAVTLSAAEILGVADRVGSLEAGKDASFLVTDGDPLEILTNIDGVWIGGREVDLSEAHQRRLLERYRTRPRVHAVDG